MISRFANPDAFMRLSGPLLAPLAILAAGLIGLGLVWGLGFSPADSKQDESVRIMYVHVPSAWMALGVYTFMGAASMIGYVWRHALADVAARAAAPIGATFAALCLITGSFWGRATWEVWWEWEPRLTAMLILFLTYLAYLGLWAAIEDEAKAARLAGVLCMAGLINIPIVRFSVDFMNGLHQTASLSPAAERGIHASMLGPLLTTSLGFAALFGALVLARMRAAILRRRAQAAQWRALEAA